MHLHAGPGRYHSKFTPLIRSRTADWSLKRPKISVLSRVFCRILGRKGSRLEVELQADLMLKATNTVPTPRTWGQSPMELGRRPGIGYDGVGLWPCQVAREKGA